MATTHHNSAPSFVTDVLATAGRLEKDDINATLEKLSQQIDEVKVELYDALQKKYVDFYPNLNMALDLDSRVESLAEDMQNLGSKIEGEVKGNLNMSSAEFEDLALRLRESKLLLDLLEKMLTMNTCINAMETSLRNQDYVSALDSLHKVEETQNKVVHKREDEIKAMAALKNHFLTQTVFFRSTLDEAWSSAIKWSKPSETKATNKKQKLELSVVAGKKEQEALGKAVQVLAGLDLLEPKIQMLAERVFSLLIQPLVTCSEAVVKTNSDMDAHTLTLTYITDKAKSKAVAPEQVNQRLLTVLEFLQKHLLAQTVKNNNRDMTLMEIFGEKGSAKCLQLIVDECLAPSVPTSKKDLETYGEVISAVQCCQKALVDLAFIKSDDSTLTDFVDSVNVRFANKKTQEVIEKARLLMTSSVHNTVRVSSDQFGDSAALGLEGSSIKKAKTESVNLPTAAKLSSATFKFPECTISTYVQDLIQLCYSTMSEASSSSPQCAKQLFYAVRYMVELFCNVVPTYHKQALSSLPHHAAVHHNDCMYLAHHLLSLGHQYRSRLPEPLCHGTATFVDQVPKLRRLGTQCFMDQMQTQRKQIQESLATAQGFGGQGERESEQRGRQAIKQVLHQLQHLANVWQPVLPTSIYCKAIGTLFNSALTEILASIAALEDISEDDGTSLASLLSLLHSEAPHLYTEPSQLQDTPTAALLLQHVPQWGRLKEMRLLLNASLQDIADRWAEGKGPLAAEFKANEVKQMIRAIFQNTDRRANVLAKIR